ncbi:hypothetical protein K431DRAFT_284251 [Polychaeton citri CBS 116435]|uniref:Histone-lysine N-methyltransferase, H3 lysine-36 specific n=1 Tax=Polychaeton citri CBS 116435 TaxID=1314669 RepID=A0A9P4QC16_9PEZI|nr:hypothetical protein K431DRAFT_284251 [Polychaeton citri CBS 116435]
MEQSANNGRLESEVRDMHLEEDTLSDDGVGKVSEGGVGRLKMEDRSASASRTISRTGTPNGVKKPPRSPMKLQRASQSPVKDEEEVVGGDVTLKVEPGQPPKLERSRSRKVERRPPKLFHDYEDRTREASSTFEVLASCTYANKYLGSTDTALECDCAEEWDPATQTNHACGEDSDCINRATKMECAVDCGCGDHCQNQRFLRKRYAKVSVIKTEKKGYGLRADEDLKPNDFVFEYIGEAIGEQSFRRRMQQYDEEGIKHFYFMSLTKGEFVDATKKGNLGRFCNHSCNPNCYVDKWVVGDKLRMGIFTERKIQAGEELVFNYNVDRYGADPQPCYCDEPNCTGYIGGKTQTERGTKLSHATCEALGIDDADAWDTAVAKKPRKKKVGEDDEEYVNNVEPRGLDEGGVTKVMATLMQCKEKWIAVKLLNRIQRADDSKVQNRIVRMHGYQILKTTLSTWTEDTNITLQVLEILDSLPRLTKNKIQDSKIEEVVQRLTENDDETVVSKAQGLLDDWSKLEVAYRIPRMKRDPTQANIKTERVDRRGIERRRSRSRSRTRSKSPERMQAPTGPRNAAPHRGGSYHQGPRPFRNRPPPPHEDLPPGWLQARAPNGSIYYYENQTGQTTWKRPTAAASGLGGPAKPAAVQQAQSIEALIQDIVAKQNRPTPKPSQAEEPKSTGSPKRSKEDAWRRLPEEKQRKIYENTIHPIVMHVAKKFTKHIPRDDWKRFAKDQCKKIVRSDFEKKLIANPYKVDEKHKSKIKMHTHDVFKKAAKKHHEREKQRREQGKSGEATSKDDEINTPLGEPSMTALATDSLEKDDLEDIVMSDEETAGPDTPAEKRRFTSIENGNEESVSSPKKQRLDSQPPPPPPPPPPPAGEPDDLQDEPTDSNGMAHPQPEQQEQAMGSTIRDVSGSHLSGSRQPSEPQQFATPPTTGSPRDDEAQKESKKEVLSSMNPERTRQLGIIHHTAE